MENSQFFVYPAAGPFGISSQLTDQLNGTPRYAFASGVFNVPSQTQRWLTRSPSAFNQGQVVTQSVERLNTNVAVGQAILLSAGLSCQQWNELILSQKHHVVYGAYAKAGVFLNAYGRSNVIRAVDSACDPNSWSPAISGAGRAAGRIRGAGIIGGSFGNTDPDPEPNTNTNTNTNTDPNPNPTPGSSGGGFDFSRIDWGKILQAGGATAASIFHDISTTDRINAQHSYELQLAQLRNQLPYNPGLQGQYNQMLQLQSLLYPQNNNNNMIMIALLAAVAVGVGAFVLVQSKKS
jgi:hypothetical protein